MGGERGPDGWMVKEVLGTMTELLELKKNKARPHLSNSVAARRLPVSGDASGGALGAKNDSGVGWGGVDSSPASTWC